MQEQIKRENHLEWAVAIGLLVLGAALRLIALGALPYGLNQDEASAGYEAFALLQAGIDRCGNAWPLLFVSWGSGQNVLLSYLALPFVALLGLGPWSIRLPCAICGCLTLPVFWRLARRCGGRRFGLLALGLLALNPWHIMISRWGLESNLLPFFLLLGIWLTVLARDRPWALVGAAAAFGLALYAYGTAFFFLPLFLIGAVIQLRKTLRPGSFCTALALFLLLALPIAACQLINVLGLEPQHFLGLTLPRLTHGRQAATSVLGGGGFQAALENFRGFLHILWQGTDGLDYNALPLWRGGIAYFFGLPTAVIGFLYSLLHRKDRREEGLMRLALVCGLICGFLIRCNINRINMFWLPLVYFSALGCQTLCRPLRAWAALPLAGVLACFFLFLSAYTGQFGGGGDASYFPGLGQALTAASQAAEGGTVYVSDWVNQPYIFALFYGEVPPAEFVDSVEYADADAAFRQVRRFRGYEFQDPSRAAVLVLHRSQLGEETVLGYYGHYALCKPSEP